MFGYLKRPTRQVLLCRCRRHNILFGAANVTESRQDAGPGSYSVVAVVPCDTVRTPGQTALAPRRTGGPSLPFAQSERRKRSRACWPLTDNAAKASRAASASPPCKRIAWSILEARRS